MPAPKTTVTVTEVVAADAIKIDIPTARHGGGNTSPYKFDELEVGGFFGVKERDKKGMSSAVGNANRKWRKPKLDEAGNAIYKTKNMTGADGSVTPVPDTDNPETVQERHFRAIDVTPEIAKQIKGTPLEGSKCLVQRDQ